MQQLSQNALILLINNFATAVLAFALTIIISRGLGDSAFGQYAAVMAWVLPLTLVADFGLNTLITRDVAQHPALAQFYLHRSHMVRALVGTAVVVGVWMTAPLLSDEALVVMGLRVAILLAVIDAFFGSYTAVFRAWERFTPIVILNVGYLGLQVASALIIVAQNGDIVQLLALIVAADIVQLGFAWLLWQRWRHDRGYTVQDGLKLHTLTRRTRPFVVAGVLAMLQMRVMIILLDQLVSTAAVGWYAAAFRLVEAARMAPNAYFVALFPRLAALVVQPQHFAKIIHWSALALIAYGIGFGIVMHFTGEWLVLTLFGEEFAATIAILGVLSWSLLPSTLRALLTLYHYAYNDEGYVNKCLLLGLVIQLGAGVGLVLRYGVAAAGWAVIIGECVLMICLAIKQHPILKPQ